MKLLSPCRCALGCLRDLNSCCCSRKKRRGLPRSQQNKTSPLPLLKVLAIGSIVFVDHFQMLMIFPFLPFMIQSFFPELSREELGQQAGYLGAAYFIGNFIGSLLWGWVSDIWGRRPVMLLGVCGIMFSVLLFGFSQTFAWAVAARFLCGILNGNLGVAKTYLSEVCDDTNQAKGFSVIALSASIGRLVGPAVGGFFAQPAGKYSLFETPFFCQFPFLLPCLFGFATGVISLTCGFLFLEETLHKTIKNPDTHSQVTIENGDVPGRLNEGDSDDETGSINSNDTNVEMLTLVSESDVEEENLANGIVESDIDSQSDSVVNTDTELLLNEEEEEEERVKFRVNVKRNCNMYFRRVWAKITSLDPAAVWRQFLIQQKEQCKLCLCIGDVAMTKNRRGCLKMVKDCTWRKVWQWVWHRVRLVLDRRVFLAISLYGIAGFAGLMTNEVVPLLVVTDYAHGGYNMTETDIGMFVMGVAIFQIFFQPFCFPWIVKLLGYRHTYQAGMVVFAVSCVVLPFTNQITGPVNIINATNCSGEGSGCGSGVDPTNITLDYCQQREVGEEQLLSNLPIVVWVVMMLVLLVHLVSSVVGMTAVFVFVGNSSLPATRGTVNGVSQSQVAVFRTAAPLIGALLFAWSEENGLGWPLNYHLVFVLCAVISVASVLLSCLMPKSIEKKRES